MQITNKQRQWYLYPSQSAARQRFEMQTTGIAVKFQHICFLQCIVNYKSVNLDKLEPLSKQLFGEKLCSKKVPGFKSLSHLLLGIS